MKLYGKNAVIERLRTNPQTVRQIYLQEHNADSSYILKKARGLNIPVYIVPKSKILKLARHTNSQGVLVDVDDFAYHPLEEAIDLALNKNYTLVFLDNLNDPQNLGAIMRSLACLGHFALVLPTHDSVSVTEAVLRVASGGDNYVPVAMVNNLNQAIFKAKKENISIMGAVTSGGEDLRNVKFSFPLGLVVGSEQKGIRDVVRKNLDKEITIPMYKNHLSLNVAQAVTVLGYEITKQKK